MHRIKHFKKTETYKQKRRKYKTILKIIQQLKINNLFLKTYLQ